MKRIIALTLLSTVLITGCVNEIINQRLEQPIEQKTQQLMEQQTQQPEVRQTQQPEGVEVGETENFKMFKDFPDTFVFSSGAGGWSTQLNIQENGMFEGYYCDSELGAVGKKYPNGTVYECNFSGKFSAPERIDKYTFSMKLESIELAEKTNKKRIEDGMKYISSEPYGLENANEVIIYLPGCKQSKLPEELKMWLLGHGDVIKSNRLSKYCLYSVEDQAGFVGYDD